MGLLRSQHLDHASGKLVGGTVIPHDKRKSSSSMAGGGIGVHRSANNKRLQRLFEPAWPIRQNRVKEVYRYEKEMKIARQIGRTLLSILDGSDLLNTGPEYGRDLSQALRQRNQCKDNLVQQRQKQFLEIIRAKVNDEPSQNPVLITDNHANPKPPAVNPSMTVKPVIKTYSRKHKQVSRFKPVATVTSSHECNSEPEVSTQQPPLRFVPATLNSLVGMRGLLLSLKPLREQVVEPCYTPLGGAPPILQTSFNDPMFFGLPRQQSLGAVAPTASSIDGDTGRLTHGEADARLRNRFMSLFFWPALMATIKPDERRYILFRF